MPSGNISEFRYKTFNDGQGDSLSVISGLNAGSFQVGEEIITLQNLVNITPEQRTEAINKIIAAYGKTNRFVKA